MEPLISTLADPPLTAAALPEIGLTFGPGLGELFRLQTRILRAMAGGESAPALAEELCAFVRRYAGDRIVSIHRLGADEKLHPVMVLGAEPALAATFSGLSPGPQGGSCGAAIHRGAPVIVGDTQTDPVWAELHEIVERWGIRSCWSQPVFLGGRAIGTVAITGRMPGFPSASMLRLLEQAAAIAGSILQLQDLQDSQQQQSIRMRLLSGFNAMLAQVNALAASRPDEATLYEGICRIAIEQAGLRLVWIGAPDAAGVFHPAAAAGATGFLDHVYVTTDATRAEGRGLSGVAWRERRTVVRQRFGADNMFAPWLAAAQRFSLGAGAAMPLMLRGAPRAVLHLYAGDEGVLNAELIGLAEELAVDIGRALEAIDQQRHLDRLQALHSALLTEGEVLLQARSEAEMLDRTCAYLANSALFHLAWVARPDADGLMRPLAGAGTGLARLLRERFALDDDPPALIVRAWRERRSHIRDDILRDPSLARYRALMEEENWHSAAMLPIRRGGEVFAILALGSPLPDLFKADVLALCERIAELLGRGLDEFDLKQTVEHERGRQFHLARHDPLTGLPNRLLLGEYLGPALARAQRRDAPLAVCMLDIDDFKPINDRWGHAVGDQLLREVASRLHGAMRRTDLIARLGGDEFVLALEEPGGMEALAILLDRLAAAMEAPFVLTEGSVRVGLSIGVAVFPADGDDADMLLRRADAALYRAKAAKTGRTSSWQRWDDGTGEPAAVTTGLDDPYGAEAKRLLHATADLWPAVAAAFTDEFFAGRARWPSAAAILDTLTPEALARLRVQQTAHLAALMAPDTDHATLLRRAQALGRIHALVGVDGTVQMQAMTLYQARLAQRLGGWPLSPRDRQNLTTVALARLQDDSAAQMQVRSDLIATYFDMVLRPPSPPELPWVDALHVQLDAVATLPGVMIAGLLRPDAAGQFQVVASGGTGELSFARIREATRVVPQLDAAAPEGNGLVAMSWRSGEIVSAANFQTDPRTAPWHAAARRFNVRSGIVLPLRDMDDRMVAALLLIGAYPAQFESMWMRHFCAGVAQTLARLWQQRRGGASVVVSETVAASWRRRLFTGGLRMHYQPLVDLRHGRPYAVEALARLEQEDGTLISPGQFLPVLGARDLDELFRLGLAESLDQLMRWDDAGLQLKLSLNLAPSTLTRPDCAFWVREALARAGIMPDRLGLEITETEALAETEASNGTITALADLGVRLMMDDLGAGFSSLERLRRLPFAAVKVDQALVRDVRLAPDRTMHFIGALIRLAHDLEIRVIVEGLETPDLVEAAAILGAHAGQGYALARPMPGAAIPGWIGGFHLEPRHDAPQSALGALASMWRAAHVGEGGTKPVAECPITAFLIARDLETGPLGRAHERLHDLARRDGRASAGYRSEAARFQHALADMARAEG